MITTIDQNLDSSLYLWLDSVLVKEGGGFRNYSGSFSAGAETPAGIYAYDAPHRQFVYDSSVAGANVISGVYVGGVLTPKGTGSTSMRIDYNQGQALFLNSTSSSVSGNYSYKEINLYYNSLPAETVLFENKFVPKPKYNTVSTWNNTDKTYPLIFITPQYGVNKTITFDAVTSTTFPYRLTVLADTPILLRTICSLIRDKQETFIAMFNPSELPFTELGDLKSFSFNYASAVAAIQPDSNRLAKIISVKISPFTDRVNALIGPRVYAAFIDVTLELFRFPHL